MRSRQKAGQGGATGAIGLVLAGGSARRLGGADKALLQVGGRPILARILAVLRPHLAQVAISANGPAERFAGFGCPVLPDPPGLQGEGPLAGLAAAMAAWPDCILVTVPGDAPFLPADLVPQLLAAAGAEGAALARCGARRHPVCAAWTPAALARLPAWLDGGGRAVGACLEAVGAVAVDWAPAVPDPFANINTPEDLAAAQALA